VSATQIAQNLAYINWTVLAGLALGAYAAVVLLRRRTAATRGYLAFVAACAIGFGVLALSVSYLNDAALDLGWIVNRRLIPFGFAAFAAPPPAAAAAAAGLAPDAFGVGVGVAVVVGFAVGVAAGLRCSTRMGSSMRMVNDYCTGATRRA